EPRSLVLSEESCGMTTISRMNATSSVYRPPTSRTCRLTTSRMSIYSPTSLVLSKGTNNKTLPKYIKENDIICLDYYNAIVINVSSEFQQHALNQHCHSEPETSNNILFFSQTIGILTDILYERERKELPLIWIFKEFHAVIESEDKRLKTFFDELYLSTNPSRKNKNTIEKVSKQLVFLYYFICSIRNKFVNNAKRDLGMYLDSTGTPNSTIDTMATLGLTITSCSISYHKDTMSEKHLTTVESSLTDIHFATILLNPIKNEPAISKQYIYNPVLVDTSLIKIGIENYFMSTYSISHNQR
ncbi:8998_t:CDS:2, partial [Funneliformis caledonium]